MSQSFSISVANIGLKRAFDEIAKSAGVTYKEVVRSETAKILEIASKNTTAAQVKLIEARVNNRIARTYNGKTYLMAGSSSAPKGWRLSDAVWQGIKKQIKDGISRRKAARGLAKKSWKQIADNIGLTVSVPSYVESATTTKGDYPQNGKASEESNGPDFFIHIRNSRTYSSSVFDAIRQAMNGREKFFRENLKRGVFKNIASIAAKYPGLYTK